MTAAWKKKLGDLLAANKKAGKQPGNQAQLGQAIGVHRTAIRKMMLATSSKLVDAIVEVLPELGMPMQEAPAEPPVDPPVVGIVKSLNEQQQADVLEFIQKYILPKSK